MAVTASGRLIAHAPWVATVEMKRGQECAIDQYHNMEAKTAPSSEQLKKRGPALLKCVPLMVTMVTGVNLALVLKLAEVGLKPGLENATIPLQWEREEIVLV